MSFSADLKVVFPPPHPAGRPFVAGCLIVFFVSIFVSRWLAIVGLALSMLCWFFFRDPSRVAPTRPGVIVAPADGRVVSITRAPPPPELGLGPMSGWRISIFLSVVNVHVNRIPASGTVTRIAYRHGAFFNAWSDKASELNERNAISVRLADGREYAVVQIAGLIARRIVCSVREGDSIYTGDRFGIIRFGSRADLYLPHGVEPMVYEGQTMIGGETIVADCLV